jgi:hypothetical protein
MKMKTSLLVKFALAGAVLASTLSAASAAPRHHVSYGYNSQSDGQSMGDEQRTRDWEANQNG